MRDTGATTSCLTGHSQGVRLWTWPGPEPFTSHPTCWKEVPVHVSPPPRVSRRWQTPLPVAWVRRIPVTWRRLWAPGGHLPARWMMGQERRKWVRRGGPRQPQPCQDCLRGPRNPHNTAAQSRDGRNLHPPPPSSNLGGIVRAPTLLRARVTHHRRLAASLRKHWLPSRPGNATRYTRGPTPTPPTSDPQNSFPDGD